MQTIIVLLIAVLVAVFVFGVARWAWGHFSTLAEVPPVRSYDGLAPGPVPPVNELVHDDIPLQSPPKIDWRHDAFESALYLDDALQKAGYSDDERAAMIDQPIGSKLSRKKKAE